MKITPNAAYTNAVITDDYLGTRLLAFPEIKKTVIKAVCDEENYCLLNKVLGYGRAITEKDLKNNDKMFIAANHITWAIMPRLRQPFTVCDVVVGNGAGLTDITFAFTEDWGTPGMVLMFQDGSGGFVNLYLTSTGTSTSSCFHYTAKLMTSDTAATFDPALAPVGRKVGWTTVVNAACADTTTKIPQVFNDWYTNYTTIMKPLDTICRSGIQQVTWLEGENGTRCWLPQEEYQFFKQFLKSFEWGGWYNTSTVNSSGVVNSTDQDSNKLQVGEGVFSQIAAGNKFTYSIATYTDPAQYANFRTFIKGKIEDWSIAQGLTAGVELDIWAGLKAYSLLQDVLVEFLTAAGGCCFMRDYESGEVYEVKAGVHIKQYSWSGFTINLRKCAVFDDPSVNGFYQTGAVPRESYKFIVMPDATCDGTPLIQVYFRGGCGIEKAFMHKIIPGTIDPRNPDSMDAVNTFDGFQVYYLTEYVFVVNDPSKLLVFSGIA